MSTKIIKSKHMPLVMVALWSVISASAWLLFWSERDVPMHLLAIQFGWIIVGLYLAHSRISLLIRRGRR